MLKGFCHLHVHTEYSMMDGLCRLEALFAKAEKIGYSALSITDHHSVSGVINFYKLAQEYGIKPVIGVELNMATIFQNHSNARYHLTVLAKDNQGYTNILKMLTRANLHNDCLTSKAMFEEHKHGLIVLSGCQNSELDQWILQDYDKARIIALEYRNILGKNNYYLEVQRFGHAEEEEVIKAKIRLARELQIPLVATNNVHYLERTDVEAHVALSGIQQLSTEESYTRKTRAEYYLKDSDEMENIFRDIPEAIANTCIIAERCNLSFDLEQLYFPHFSVPDDYTKETYLYYLCQRGLFKHYGGSAPTVVAERLEFELGVINKMGYAGYFLIMWDIVQYAREQGILTAGRGSAVSSLVCYLLGITHVNPIDYELYFERFLNPERTSMPDIDLDIDHIGRKKILQYISDKYGQENMAHISAFSTFAPQAVVRDVARVQGWPEDKLTPLTRFIAHQNIHQVDAPTNSSDFKYTYAHNEAFRRLIDTASKLEGLPRHYTQHSAGVVISKDSLTNYTSLQYSRDGEVITQFDMRTIEDLGLLKIDLLGIRFLSAIRLTLNSLKLTRGLQLSYEKIPLDDLKTYNMIQRGDTIGCFQLESGGCRKLLQQLRPASLQEIMFATSLYRPGPIEGGMVHNFVARLHEEEEVEYHHPLLEDLLKDTFGVVLFQEQVMLIARDIAGFTLGEADILRKAISKKDRLLLAEQKSKFVKGAISHGLSGAEANYIFDKLHKFAGYGFCKAHAAAYAHIAYITAYLKAHYPVEYLTSLFNVNLQFDHRFRQYLNQARFRQIPILPPDINASQMLATTEDDKIRMGFLMIKGLGQRTAEEIIIKREQGEYRSLSDFCHRVDLSVLTNPVLDNLIKAGAFDGLGERIHHIWSWPKIYKEAKENQVTSGQLRCLPNLPNLKVFEAAIHEADLVDILRWEIETMGHPISANPLIQLLKDTDSFLQIKDLDQTQAQVVRVAGEITALRFRWTQRGKLICFFTLEDLTGTAEVTVFEPFVSRYKKQLISGNIVVVKAKMEKEKNIYNLIAEEIIPLEDK